METGELLRALDGMAEAVRGLASAGAAAADGMLALRRPLRRACRAVRRIDRPSRGVRRHIRSQKARARRTS